MSESTRRKPGSGMEPNVAAAVAYLGGIITGVVMLVVEKEDRFVRFHALQSTVTFLVVFVVHLVLSGLPVVGGVLYVPFVILVVVLWIFLIAKAFAGQRYKLPYVGDFVENQIK
jgi:uncharacterized membrane protein